MRWLLFDGKDVEGRHGKDEAKWWKVENG